MLRPISPRSNLAAHVQARHAWARASMRAHTARMELERAESRMTTVLRQMAALARELDDDSCDPEGLRRPKGVLEQTHARVKSQISAAFSQE